MTCEQCNHNLEEGAEYCRYCGSPVEGSSAFVIPEGFLYDKASGWYHKSELVRNRKGALEPAVTYYNPLEHTYLKELPRNHPSYDLGEGNEDKPIGEVADYLYDEVGRVYYLTDTITDPKTKGKIQRVSYFFPKKREFLNINYSVSTAKPQPPSPENSLQAKGIGKKQKAPKGGRKWLRWLSLGVGLLAFLLAVYFILMGTGVIPRGMIGDLWASGTGAEQASPPLPDWPKVPHVSSYYKYAREEGEYLYFLSCDDRGQQALYRTHQTEHTTEPLVFGSEDKGEVAGFALTAEYLYYSLAQKNGTEASYYRQTLRGTDQKFLFQSDNSALVSHDGKIYLLLPSNNKLRILHPESPNPLAFQEVSIPASSERSVLVANSFSVQGGVLYYGELLEGHYDYFALDLAAGTRRDFLVREHGDAVYSNPVWQGNSLYTVKTTEQGEKWQLLTVGESESILAEYIVRPEDGEFVPFYSVTDTLLVYQTGDSVHLENQDANTSLVVETEEKVLAMTPNWLVLEKQLYYIPERAFYPIEVGYSPEETALQRFATTEPAVTSSEQGLAEDMLCAASVAVAVLGESHLEGEELLPAVGILLEDTVHQKTLLADKRVLQAPMSNLLWEAFATDFQTLEFAVEENHIPNLGVVEGELRYQAPKTLLTESYQAQLHQVDEEKGEALVRVTREENKVEEYLVCFRPRENPALCRFEIISVTQQPNS